MTYEEMLQFKKQGFDEAIEVAEQVIKESEYIHPKCRSVIIKELKEQIK
jgi:hypothetical protein